MQADRIRLQQAPDFTECRVEILYMFQNLVRDDEVERSVGERQPIRRLDQANSVISPIGIDVAAESVEARRKPRGDRATVPATEIEDPGSCSKRATEIASRGGEEADQAVLLVLNQRRIARRGSRHTSLSSTSCATWPLVFLNAKLDCTIEHGLSPPFADLPERPVISRMC